MLQYSMEKSRYVSFQFGWDSSEELFWRTIGVSEGPKVNCNIKSVQYIIRLSPGFNAKINPKYSKKNLAFSARKPVVLVLHQESVQTQSRYTRWDILNSLCSCGRLSGFPLFYWWPCISRVSSHLTAFPPLLIGQFI